MSNLQLPKAVIFDWDNTLVDTWPLIQSAIDDTMVKMGKKPWGLERVKKDIHKSMRESFPEIFGDKWQEAGDFYQNHYHSNNLRRLELLPNAMELINRLEEKGVLMVVVSNKMGTTLRKEVEYLGIKDKFFAAIGASDAAYDKPSRDPVDLALEGGDVNPDKDLVWFIGDTLTDIECAINSNCQPLLYGCGAGIPAKLIEKERNDKEKPLLQFFDYLEILNLIENKTNPGL